MRSRHDRFGRRWDSVGHLARGTGGKNYDGPNVGLRGLKAASASDIEPVDYVGAATLPCENGTGGALELLIFLSTMKGANEGSFSWEFQPGSTMTNDTVLNAVEGVSGRELPLVYPTGSKQITLPVGVPVVTFAEVSAADLTAGAPVFVPATKAADGSLTRAFVVIGNQGVVPSM